MASEAQSNAKERPPRRPPVAGLLVLLVVGMAVLLPLMADAGCSATRGPGPANPEPMELSGRWLGMILASADSGTAKNLGVPSVVAGVVVAEVARDATSRVAQAGLAPGDVIVKVDGTSTGNLAELYTLTTRLNTARPLPLDVMRQGQTMTVVLPPPMDALVQQPMPLQQPGLPPAALPQAGAWSASPQAAAQPIAQQPTVQPGMQQTNTAGSWPVTPAAISPNNGLPGVMGR